MHEDPRMMTGLFRDRTSAERAYAAAAECGYTQHDVNLLMSQETRDRYFPKMTPGGQSLGRRRLRALVSAL